MEKERWEIQKLRFPKGEQKRRGEQREISMLRNIETKSGEKELCMGNGKWDMGKGKGKGKEGKGREGPSQLCKGNKPTSPVQCPVPTQRHTSTQRQRHGHSVIQQGDNEQKKRRVRMNHGMGQRERDKKTNRDSTCGAHTHGPTRRVDFNIQQSSNPTIQQLLCSFHSIQFGFIFQGVCPSKSTNKPRGDGYGYLFGMSTRVYCVVQLRRRKKKVREKKNMYKRPVE